MPPHQAKGEARRAAIMAFLRTYITRYGFAPSMQEVADGVGLSSLNSTRNHLLWLQDDGYLDIVPGIARGMRLLDPAPDGWTADHAEAS